ncbi:MAG: hypothetical protein IPN89_18580, partial [Saprospiraceae bacterium]|nr:hypothetical protein [Saprospiraceae bacterium]
SNNNLKAYVNGNLNWTTTINDQITNTSSKIGTNFNGTMDEFRYWNVALSQSQIQERMDATLIGNETSLTRYYHFDHGNAGLNNGRYSSVRDKSSNLPMVHWLYTQWINIQLDQWANISQLYILTRTVMDLEEAQPGLVDQRWVMF